MRQHADAVAMGGEIFRPQAELDGDALLPGGDRRERLLQIAAVDRPIGCAIALLGAGQGHAHDLVAVGRAQDVQRRRNCHHWSQAVGEPKIDQNAGSIG